MKLLIDMNLTPAWVMFLQQVRSRVRILPIRRG